MSGEIRTDETNQTPDETDTDAEEKKDDLYVDPLVYRQKRKKKIGKRIGLILILTVMAVYIGGVIFHMNRFGTMTTVNGFDVSGKSVKDVEDLLLADAGTYSLHIVFADSECDLAVGDANSKAKLTESVSSVLKKNSPFLWFADSFRRYDYKIGYTVSCEKDDLKTYMLVFDSMNVSSMEDPQDAKVVLQDGEAIVIPETMGTKLDTDKVYDKVLNAMRQYEDTVDLEEEGCYITAHILSDSEIIAQEKAAADAFLSIEACYDFGDYQYKIPKEELTKMAYVSDDGTIQISRNNVAAFVDDFSDQFTTADTDREFVTHDGKTISVHGGYYGWVIDTEEETEELYELLCKKESFTKEPACSRRGYAMTEQNDIGSTYIEVDLTEQHVYFFLDGVLTWDSDCVTGRVPDHKTPGGLYGITYKARNATLRGEDYETPVSYWMPFNGGIGLHDATWRSKFGGDIYTYSGSHGCVNLPLDKAGELFEYVETGMPVVCYWRDDK